jgi:hypothetical protein
LGRPRNLTETASRGANRTSANAADCAGTGGTWRIHACDSEALTTTVLTLDGAASRSGQFRCQSSVLAA